MDKINFIFTHLFLYPIFTAILINIIAAPLGCILLWKRMAYFGDALSHSAILGIVVSLFFNISPVLGGMLFTIIFSSFFIFCNKYSSNDALLGILAYSSLALAIIISSLMPRNNFDLDSYLFGDILLVRISDIVYLIGFLLVFIIWFKKKFNNILLFLISEELAFVQGIRIARMRFEIIICLAIFIAMSFKLIGMMLITATLIIPAATARIFSKNPKAMIVYSILIGIFSSVLGLFFAFIFDIAANASIILNAFILFIVFNLIFTTKRYYVKSI